MNLNNVLALWEAWWERTNDQPLIYVVYPTGDISEVERYRKDWMSPDLTSTWSFYNHEQLFGQALELVLKTGRDHYVDDAIAYLRAFAKLIGHHAAGYSFFHPGIAPACLGAILSGHIRLVGTSIWGGTEDSASWDEVTHLLATKSRLAELVEHHLPRFAEAMAGLYIVSMPDYGDGLDTLSTLRKPESLMFDLCDTPETLNVLDM